MNPVLAKSLVVVTGLPRSGTSLVMSMLRAGGMPVLADGTRQADHDNPRGYFEYEPVKRLATAPASLSQMTGCAVKVVIPLVRYLQTEADVRLIWIHRSLDEVLSSQSAMISHRGLAGAGSSPLLERVLRNQMIDMEGWLGMRPQIPLLRLEHRSVIADPHSTAVALNEFLGSSLDVGEMARCVDPALHRQRSSTISSGETGQETNRDKVAPEPKSVVDRAP